MKLGAFGPNENGTLASMRLSPFLSFEFWWKAGDQAAVRGGNFGRTRLLNVAGCN
jgi:hypothetical protein